MHPAQAASMDRVAELRAATCSGQVSGGGGPLGGDLHCDLDAEIGTTTASFDSAPGGLLSVDVRIEGQPRWVVLRLQLGEARFQPGDVLGVALRGSYSHESYMGVYLRMVRDGHFTDTRLAEGLKLGTRDNVLIALHTLSAADPACGAPGDCALIFGLPREEGRFQIRDLHFFVMPAEEGLRSAPIDLSSFAA